MALKKGDILDERKRFPDSCGLVVKIMGGGEGFAKVVCCGHELTEDDLVTEIAEASRIDAQLSRTPFEPIDLGRLIGRAARNQPVRETGPNVKVSYAGPGRGHIFVMGDPQKLARVIENLVDNVQ